MDELHALERLIRRYSPSGREASAVREFVRLARELGYRARIDAVGNGVARRGVGSPRVLFLGHIDTVEGELAVRRRRGRLYGRGAVDAKGPLIAALLAGAHLSGDGEYRVVAAVGEETDSRGARYLLAGPRPDALIVGEPSGWDGVTVGYKGELQLEATFRGRRTHYSSPIPTTTDRAIEWVTALHTLAAGRRGASSFHSLSVKTIAFTSRRHGDDETAQITVDLRLPPGLSTRELLRSLPRAPGRPTVAVKIHVEPVEVDRTNPVAASLLAAIREAGGRPTVWRKAGTSDLNLAAPAWKVPAAAYGPGNARLDHTDREWVSAADLRRAVAVLHGALGGLRRALSTPR